jgi:DNA-binding GntR family transcriptional regulator
VKTLATPTRQDAVLSRLREALITGEIAPGAHLVQDDLAARYGVSRIPLREALRTLESEGLVTIEPNRGAVCRPLEPKDLVDLYDLRICLEQFAVSLDAAAFVDIRPTTAALAVTARAAIQRRDLDALIQADSAFHREIARATGNEHLLRSLDSSWSLVVRAMRYFLALDAYPKDVWPEHEAIATAIAVGDAARAQALIETHICTSRTVILNSLQESSYERARTI